jgi:hypothetical protein
MLKLDLSKNVVSLFAVVINNQLDFIFTKKFKISFRPITIDYSDNENSPLDRLEGEQTRDEGLNGILSIDIDYALNALIKHFDAGLSNVEVIYYHFLININDFQKNMVFMTLARFTGIDIDAFYGLNKKRFIEAWYCVCCILRKNNFPEPTQQYEIELRGNETTIADFAYIDKKVLIYIDGLSTRYHGNPIQAEKDKIKRTKAKLLGWSVLEIAANALKDESLVEMYLELLAGWIK